MQTIDKYILKECINPEFWERNEKFLTQELFSKDIYNVVDSIRCLHDSNVLPSWESVKDHVLESGLLSNQKKKFYEVLFVELEKTNTSEKLAEDYLKSLYSRKTAQKIADVAIEVVNGKKDLIELKSLLAFDYNGPKEETACISTNIDSLIDYVNFKGAFPFDFSPLAEKVPGAGRGDLMIILARPETGKSAFVAHLNVGYMRAGYRVLYIANEEPGQKVMLNHVRSACELSDDEILYWSKKDRTKFDPWYSIENQLHLVHGSRFTLDDVEKRIEEFKPDVVVLDQADKIRLNTTTNSPNHEMLKQLYMSIRELAQVYDCLVVAVSQASASGSNKLHVSMDDMDSSKTGKPGEADLIIGIGKRDDDDDNRCLYISKNKKNGWHGPIYCKLDRMRCRYVP